jgi:NAD(P)-dependent dehydrogenase (short-subunit alcohol dehydrogenase family)
MHDLNYFGHHILLQKLAGSTAATADGHIAVLLLCLPAAILTAPAVMEIDAVGTFTMSRAAFEALKQNRESVIINISATLHYGATWYQVHASAAKAAVDSITRSLALEWGEYGIRVNGVAPGPIRGTAGGERQGAAQVDIAF